MDKITENANNLAKELITTADSQSYIQVVNPTTGKMDNMKISDLASVVAASVSQLNTLIPSGGVYEDVDLGLPSGTLWAKYNVGATSETDYGDLFAWGATEPYRLNGTKPIGNTSHYASSYANTIQHDLYPNEDAATVHWGKGWRMPTKAQFEELLANTTVEWTAINDINGRKFTASNGKYIFFPASGGVISTLRLGHGSLGYYWSRSFDSSSLAWRLNFNSSSRGVDTNNRGSGYPVRAVRS